MKLLLSKARDGFLMTIGSEGKSENTQDLYRWALNLMIHKLGDVDIKSIRADDLKIFWLYIRTEYKPKRKTTNTEMKDQPLAGRSLENIWTAMRSFFAWAERDGLIAKRPDLKIPRPKYTKRVVDFLSEEDFFNVLKAAERMNKAKTNGRAAYTARRPTANRDQAILWMLLDTGLRASELCRLNVGDVNLQEGEVNVAPFGSGQKTKARIVYFNEKTRSALWKYLMVEREGPKPHEPLFLSRQKNRMTRHSLRLLLVDLGAKAGLKENLGPHDLRHLSATIFSRENPDMDSMIEIYGWRDYKMALIYIKKSQQDIKRAHAKGSPAENAGKHIEEDKEKRKKR